MMMMMIEIQSISVVNVPTDVLEAPFLEAVARRS